MALNINLTSVPIEDLDRAEAFYTQKLGFVVKTNIPMGDTRLLTLVSPDNPDGAQLLLEPCGMVPEVKTFREWLYNSGIPFAAFEVDDCQGEYELLKGNGVEFRGDPADMGTSIAATLDDTCGNLIMIYEDTSG
ncbi:MAG: VOC family protein [Phycisphaerales bacterium JB043]